MYEPVRVIDQSKAPAWIFYGGSTLVKDPGRGEIRG